MRLAHHSLVFDFPPGDGDADLFDFPPSPIDALCDDRASALDIEALVPAARASLLRSPLDLPRFMTEGGASPSGCTETNAPPPLD